MWVDIKRFVENPGEVLERIREQSAADSNGLRELEERHADLSKRVASKQAEKDRYVRAFAQGLISEEELAEYVADLRGQIENLRLLIASVESDLAARAEEALDAEGVQAWLMALRDRLEEIEEDSEEAYAKRRELVRLLVDSIIVGRDGNGAVRSHITYRFADPPEPSESSSEMFVDGVQNFKEKQDEKTHCSGPDTREEVGKAGSRRVHYRATQEIGEDFSDAKAKEPHGEHAT